MVGKAHSCLAPDCPCFQCSGCKKKLVQKSKLRKHQKETPCGQTLNGKQKEVDLSNGNREVDRRHLEAALFNTAIVEALKEESDAQNEEAFSTEELQSLESNKCDVKMVLCENISNDQQDLSNTKQEELNSNTKYMQTDNEAYLVQTPGDTCVLPDLVSLSLHLSSSSSSSCLTFSSPSREAVEALLAVLGGLRYTTYPSSSPFLISRVCLPFVFYKQPCD